MDTSAKSAALFDVYLRLRPALASGAERFLDVEECCGEAYPKHITVQPPSDNRKRAVEKFAFTRVFEENASQLEIFQGTGVLSLLDGVLGADARERDGLLATLGVTGSGKSHTILGSRTQRGLTQMALDVLYGSISHNMVHPTSTTSVFPSLAAADVSEAQIIPAFVFLETIYSDSMSVRGSCSRAQTPAPVGSPIIFHPSTKKSSLLLDLKKSSWSPFAPSFVPRVPGSFPESERNTPDVDCTGPPDKKPSVTKQVALNSFARITRSQAAKINNGTMKDTSYLSIPAPRQRAPRASAMPQVPSVDDIVLPVDPQAEYAVIVSMYEVYNDRIYDLLAGSVSTAKAGVAKRRTLLFKSTEKSPDRKVVAGLKKIVCSTFEEALMVLETGLIERKVAGTGSNAVSSRSHGFFCVEVKKRNRAQRGPWLGSTLTIVDLAGSERARQAKTTGATLAEAGKINESLMYLGQCMQMYLDNQESSKQNIVPFRQCKLTELLFSNSFPTPPAATSHLNHFGHAHRNPQKAIMIVTADPVGDFNATSQILRYSALAREVTVPRIPSVTSTILSAALHIQRPGTSGSNTASQAYEDLEVALKELARLTEERDVFFLELAEERSRREAAEASLVLVNERMVDLEQEIREECYEDLETRIEEERRRWKSALDEEGDRNDEHLDQKLEILARGIEVHEDPEPTNDERIRELEDENEALRRRIEILEREQQLRSPTKKQRVLKAPRWQQIEDEN